MIHVRAEAARSTNTAAEDKKNRILCVKAQKKAVSGV